MRFTRRVRSGRSFNVESRIDELFWLFDSVGEEVSFGISTASKFDMPSDVNKPVVVIAAGSGVSLMTLIHLCKNF